MKCLQGSSSAASTLIDVLSFSLSLSLSLFVCVCVCAHCLGRVRLGADQSLLGRFGPRQPRGREHHRSADRGEAEAEAQEAEAEEAEEAEEEEERQQHYDVAAAVAAAAAAASEGCMHVGRRRFTHTRVSVGGRERPDRRLRRTSSSCSSSTKQLFPSRAHLLDPPTPILGKQQQ